MTDGHAKWISTPPEVCESWYGTIVWNYGSRCSYYGKGLWSYASWADRL